MVDLPVLLAYPDYKKILSDGLIIPYGHFQYSVEDPERLDVQAPQPSLQLPSVSGA